MYPCTSTRCCTGKLVFFFFFRDSVVRVVTQPRPFAAYARILPLFCAACGVPAARVCDGYRVWRKLRKGAEPRSRDRSVRWVGFAVECVFFVLMNTSLLIVA